MYCTSCGSQNPEDARFCFKCGNRIVDLSGKAGEERQDLQPNQPPLPSELLARQTETKQKRPAGWTYFWLNAEVISATFLIALAAYWLARMVASENPEIENRLTGSGGIIFGLFVVSIGLSRSWKRLLALEPDSDPFFRMKHKRFSRVAGGFAVLCSALAIAAGVQHGECDAVVSRFASEMKQYQDTMQAIGNARRGPLTTIEDYLRMYKSIEPKVAEGRRVVSGLRTKIPRCGAFESRAGGFEFILDNLSQRLALLSREIEVAKSIESSPPADWERRWQSELVPLADQEALLEKQLQTFGRR